MIKIIWDYRKPIHYTCFGHTITINIIDRELQNCLNKIYKMYQHELE